MHVRLVPGRRLLASVLGLAVLLALALPAAAVFARSAASQPTPAAQGFYQQTNLVSDIAGVAKFTDAHLVNPWGLVHGPSTPWWVSDNGTGVSTLYDGHGKAIPLVVTIPPPAGSPAGTTAAPTGVVFNGGSGFVVSENGKSGPSLFIFATEDGTIAGWNPNVDLNKAVLAVDHSKVGAGAVYKGLAINTSGTLIYATNFRFGTVDVFDANFHQVSLAGSFTDPNLPQGYAPFGIQNIGGNLYVTYAKQNAQKHDDVAGPGHGFVDVYDANGNLIHRLISRGRLNSPWGLALAPANFGKFSNALLVGNFGDGRINAFDPNTGASLGSLKNSRGVAIQIDGLWALAFGNGNAAGQTNELFFTAGIGGEAHGLFGKIQSQS
jgi:uncharacterized protein (TIGR03118 family)